MNASSDSPIRDAQLMRVPSVEFLREQDGPPERLLKSRLIDWFKNHNGIQRAYLAQVRAGNQVNVALCLRRVGGPDPQLVKEIGVIFAAVFSVSEHLDILFLDDEKESTLARVCPPFFKASAPKL